MKGPRRLPTFKGYTVDRRLREFRRVKLGYSEAFKRPTTEIEFVSFDSPKGQQLLSEMEQKEQ